MRCDNIPLPTSEEKAQSVRTVLDAAMPERARRPWMDVPLPVLFFGVGDCLFLSCLLAGVALVPMTFAAAQAVPLAAILFLTSPGLYALLYGLTGWKEWQSGTLEWKLACRTSFHMLTALRMLCFGGLSTVVCVPVNLLLWYADGCQLGLGWMLGVSFSSLFLYAALSLLCRRLRPRQAMGLPPALWALLGMFLLCCQSAAVWLEQVPALVFLLIAAAVLALCLLALRRYLIFGRRHSLCCLSNM